MGSAVCRCKCKKRAQRGKFVFRDQLLTICPEYGKQSRLVAASASTPDHSDIHINPISDFMLNPTDCIKVNPEGFDVVDYTVGKKTLPWKDTYTEVLTYATKRPAMSSVNVELITRTWINIEKQMLDVGIFAYINLFRERPQFFNIFDKFRKIDRADIDRHVPIFAEHVLLVMTSLEKTLARRKNPNAAEAYLHHVGDIHRKAKVGRNVMPVIIPDFLHAFSLAFKNGKQWTNEMEDAWRSFMNLVVHVMSERLYPTTFWSTQIVSELRISSN